MRRTRASRGETLGVIGFVLRPATDDGGCRIVASTAADPKGSIPSALINAVARRTPRVWLDRIRAYVGGQPPPVAVPR